MIGRMRLNGIMMLRIAVADMSVTVGSFITPLGSVEIVVVVEFSVRNFRNGIVTHIKQFAANGTRLISVPAFLRAV